MMIINVVARKVKCIKIKYNYGIFCYRRGSTTASEATPEEEEVDIDLNDPEVAEAAAKIQAGFKGFKARKEVQELKVRVRQTVETVYTKKTSS